MHLTDWERSGVVGGILVRGKDGNVKCCIFLHALPSCVAGKYGNPIMSCLTWPYKLRNSFVKLGSDHKELQSGFWSRKSAEDIFVETSVKVWLQTTHPL